MRKLFKKSLACVLAVALCLTAMVGVMVVSADVTGTLDVVPNNGVAGAEGYVPYVTATFTAPVVDGVQELISEAFIAVAVENAKVVSVTLEDGSEGNEATGYAVALNDAKNIFNIKSNDGVITAKVKIVIDAAEAGNYKVTLTDVTSATDSQQIITFPTVEATVEVVAPHVHNFVETVTKAATCEEDGVKTFACECGKDTYTEAIPALGHAYDEGVVTTAPDCDHAGVKTFTCANDANHTYTDAIDPLGHTEETIPPVDATCTEDGATVGTKCSVCDAVIVAPTVIPATGHNFVDGTCGVCGEADPDYKPACEYVDADQDGICDTCGEENLDATLTFHNKGIVLGADIRGVLQVRKVNATSPYASFKVIAEKEGLKSELELASTSAGSKNTTYNYTMTVPAKELADVTNLRIVGITAEGVAFTSNAVEWSIKAGLIDSMDTYSKQETEDAAKRVKLCANILNYGAEAQKHFGYNVDNLATDGLKAEYAALIITTTPEMVSIPKAEEPAGTYATLTEIGFNLAARVQVLPRFKVPKADKKEDYKAVITKVHVAPDGTESTDTFTVEGDKILKGATSTALYVYIDNLASKELRDVMTITLYKGDEAVSVIHTFSGESALNGKKDSLPTLAPALMNYCDCARAVFG